MFKVHPEPNYICSSVSNAALITLTKALGAECLDHEVCFVGVSPVQTATERLERHQRTMAEKDLGDADR